MLADPVGVSVEQVLPRFIVVADVLKQIYQLYRDRVTTPAKQFDECDALCYLCGDARTMVHGKEVKLTTIAMKQV